MAQTTATSGGLNSQPLETPILFLVFNRPDTTAQVFEAIRNVRPRRLFVAADGPRDHKDGERQVCEQVRQIATAVDWECELFTLLRPENVGCGVAVHSAISWFFGHVDEGIILEDDCLPCPEFFPFCEALLERFRYDTRVMEIGGISVLRRFRPDFEYSYYFSNHNNIWGWATWRRAWVLSDYDMKPYGSISKDKFFGKHFGSIYERFFYEWVMESTYRDSGKTWWDYQWEFVRRLNSGLTVFPASNLVVNLGIGGAATHTSATVGELYEMHFEKVEFPLRHPPYVAADRILDRKSFKILHTTKVSRWKTRIRAVLPSFIKNWWFNRRMEKMLSLKRAQRKAIIRAQDAATMEVNTIENEP